MTAASVVVEFGFTAPTTSSYLILDDPARGLLDTGTLAPDGVFTDVSAYVAAFFTQTGASRMQGPNLRFESGTATIVLRNEDRRFDPTNLAGPYVDINGTQVLPMRAVRIRALYNGTYYPIFRGTVDTWRVNYDGPNASYVTAVCSDAFKVFNSYDRAAGVSTGAGEDTGTRIDRILDSINWPATDRAVDTGDSTLQATTLEGNALTELLLAADSEFGQFYIDRDGHATFRHRLAPLEDSRSNTSQATFGDQTGELPYADVTMDYSDDALYNVIRVTCEGGTEQTASDATSISRYLTRTYSKTGLLMETDADALQYANFALGMASAPELRFAEMHLIPDNDPSNLFPQALNRLIGDRITVKRRPPGGGAVISRDVFIAGIRHELAASGEQQIWQTYFVLQSASRWEFFVLDSATLGVLDTNRLAY